MEAYFEIGWQGKPCKKITLELRSERRERQNFVCIEIKLLVRKLVWVVGGELHKNVLM